MTVVRSKPVPLPRSAQLLRLPIHDRSQQRMRERWGFDLNDPQVQQRIAALLAGAPDDPERLLLAAAAASVRGDDSGALTQARRAVQLAPESARARTTLATVLMRTGEPGEALEEARRAAALDPDDAHAVYNCGLAELAAGERRRAMASFELAADLLGVDVRPWWQRLRKR